MKQVIIDTNVLISFLTDRNLQQQELAAELMQSAADLKIALLCHQHVVTELVYVLERIYKISPSRIRMLLSDFMYMPGVEIVHEIHFKQLFTCWPDPIGHFGDAVLADLAMTMKRSVVATFDQKFIQRLKAMDLDVFEFDR